MAATDLDGAMNLCIGVPLTTPDWTGLPLGHFEPGGHDNSIPVAAVQDTLFLWNDGASDAEVRWRHGSVRYARHRGVVDVMALDDDAHIRHDVPERAGSCLLVALPRELCERFTHCPPRQLPGLESAFALEDERACRLARALEHQCMNGEPLGRLYTETVSDALMTHVLARHGRARADPPSAKSGRRGLSPAQRAKVYGHIQAKLAEDVTLDELAGLLGYSRQHFVRLFKQTFSVSPHQFVMGMRIERAKLLVRTTRRPLAEVAAACGFFDQAHFSAQFSRRVGRSPREYRRDTA
jgi:AraC family transcriptional regulator